MNDLDSYAAYYLERLKGPECDYAYHSLIDADDAIIPILITAFRTEADPGIRAMLVEIIWQHRISETVEFLSEALNDSHPEVWKNALDGFVAIGSPSAILVLESARERMQSAGQRESVRTEWIEEAIQQIRTGSFA
jgi:HEAT repeats